MATEPQKNSFDEPDVKEESKGQEADLSAILARLNQIEEENKVMRQQLQQSDEDGEDIVQERRPAETLRLATIKGKPITNMKLEEVYEIDHKGNQYIKNFKAKCEVFGESKPVVISYGQQGNKDDFVNLPRKKFQLTKQDESDLSGASRIERNVVVNKYGKVPEIDRSEGTPTRTGRMVEQVTKRDIRYYTILVDGEEVELPEDKIYR